MSNVNDLPEKQRKLLESSKSGTFFWEFYSRVAEEPFAEINVEFPSRPNAPINENSQPRIDQSGQRLDG